MPLAIVTSSRHNSNHPQDPAHIVTIDGIEYVTSDTGKPLFHLDGSPLKEGRAWQCKHQHNGTKYRCRRKVVKFTDSVVCQKHGAGSPRARGTTGGAPSVLLSKKWERELPKSLQERYKSAVSDPELLNIDNDIALLDVRISNLIKTLPEEQESTVNFSQLRDGLQKLKIATSTRDVELTISAAMMLNSVWEPLEAERTTWVELSYLIQQRAKLISREIDRRKAIKNYITAEEAWALVKLIVNIIVEEIEDKATKNRIVLRIQTALKQVSAK